MREILFRAKAINRDKGYHRSNYKNGDWAYGLITRLYDERFENLPAEMTDLNGVSGIEIDHNTICQYTGLTDKNGNKIWENDVVERVDRRNGIYVFREQPKMNCKVVWTDRHGYDTEPSCGYFDKKNALECSVIGNTFDNTDLLKGE